MDNTGFLHVSVISIKKHRVIQNFQVLDAIIWLEIKKDEIFSLEYVLLNQLVLRWQSFP